MEDILLLTNHRFAGRYYRINDKFDVPKQSRVLLYSDQSGKMEKPDLDMIFNKIRKMQQYRYVLIIGKGDYNIGNIDNIPKNITRIYCNNYIHEDINDKIRFYPMGRDFRSIKSFKFTDPKNEDRNILCYCNFSITTHKIRQKIFDILKTKSFIKFEHMGRFLKYNIKRDQFFKNLSNSKFVICPRGAGRDSYRFYDSIYCGAIPIVVKEKFHSCFEDLPILFLDKIEDFNKLTEQYLEEQYIEISKKKKDYYEKLDFKYWLNRFDQDLYLKQNPKSNSGRA